MKRFIAYGVAICLLLMVSSAQAMPDGVGYAMQGGILPNTADYDWWYGCSPTSAGMLMGYYDLNGYGGLVYDNLVPGVAETSTYYSTAGVWEYNAQNAIASSGHVADFYTGYGNFGDDPNPSTGRSFDCLADFMGTSQDSTGQSDGSTGFYYYTNGDPWAPADAVTYGVQDGDGMYGVGEYVDYTGYGYSSLYTQLTDNNVGLTDSFTFADYMAEIDAGRTVLLHIDGHSMAGIGYDGQNIVLYDTWNPGPFTMAWGGAYSGRDLWGVTVLELTGGSPCQQPTIPVPGAFVLASIGVVFVTRRRKLQGC